MRGWEQGNRELGESYVLAPAPFAFRAPWTLLPAGCSALAAPCPLLPAPRSYSPMSDISIRVENLSKKYTIRHQPNGSLGSGFRHVLQETLTAPWRGLKAKFGTRKSEMSDSAFEEDFWAVKDVSFE